MLEGETSSTGTQEQDNKTARKAKETMQKVLASNEIIISSQEPLRKNAFGT